MAKPGNLTVKPMAGKLIYDTEIFGKMDPFITLKIGQQSYSTQPHTDAGLNPAWTQTFSFRITTEDTIQYTVFDYDIGSSNDFVGEGFYPLYPLFNKRGKISEWIQLGRQGKPAGQVLIEFEFTPDQNAQNIVGQQNQGMQNQAQQFPQQQYPQGQPGQQFPQQQFQQPGQQFPQQQFQQLGQQFPQQQFQQPGQQFQNPGQKGQGMQENQAQQFPQQQYPQQQQGQQYPQQQFQQQGQQFNNPGQQGFGIQGNQAQQFPQQQQPQVQLLQQYPQQFNQQYMVYPQQQMGQQQMGYPQQQMGYSQQQWTFNPQIDKKTLKSKAQQIFYNNDRDGNGKLQGNEVYNAICQLFLLLNHPPPPQQAVEQYKRQYDDNGDGKINKKEFTKLVKKTCGFASKKGHKK